MRKYMYLLIFFQVLLINCEKCLDSSCVTCSRNGKYCLQCKDGFIRHYSNCGRKCHNSILNCQLCNADLTKCIKCRSNCMFNGRYCDCTERYVLTVVCIFIAVSTISIIFICLLSSSWRRAINNFSLLSGYIRPSIFNNFYRNNFNRNSSVAFSEEINHEMENQINEIKILEDFKKNKIKKDKNEEKKLCSICKKVECNLKLNCGCHICFECEKKCIKINKCLNCNQDISSMQQISCSICFGNKKEISSFNCPCKSVVCKECYIKWRRQHNFCPSCRVKIS